MTDFSRGIRSTERELPHPSSISPEARTGLARAAQARASRPSAARPPASDLAGWDQAISATNEYLTSMYAVRIGDAQSTVETVEMGGAVVHVGTPKQLRPEAENRAYLEIHGGGLVFGGGEASKYSAINSADRFGVRAYAVDYRMPPRHPYPAGLDDCVAV